NYVIPNFANKVFEIAEGGLIRWTGDPTEANINLRAVYSVRTGLSNLYSAAGRTLENDNRIVAEAIMNLNGPLLSPVITFDLNFPGRPTVRDELQSYLSDQSNVFYQAINLLVRRSFAPAGSDRF